jgi:hypothetical protein
MYPFFPIKEKGLDWNIIQAVEASLTISEVIAKSRASSKMNVYRIMNKIKDFSLGIRVAFEGQLEKSGLLYIATISKKQLKEAPIYMQAERVLRLLGGRLFYYTGLLPAEDSAIEEWLSNFDESAITVRALERRWWRTNSPATVCHEGWICGNVDAVEITNASQPGLPVKELQLDDVDVLLLWAKFRWPFTPLREVEKESEKYLGRKVSHQVLSYHFRNHVLKLWAGNRIWLYADAQQVPYRLLYLEGRDAPAVARALVQLPWFHTAYIDVGKAVVSGQPPCASMPHLYRVLGDLDVDAVEFAMEVSVSKWVPIFGLLSKIVKREEAVARSGEVTEK